MLGSRTDLHIFDAGSVNGTRYCNEILLPYVRLFRGAMGLQFLFMDDNAPCHRTVAAEQLLESRRLAARTLPPVTIGELRLALQDEWAAMPQQLIDTLILSMGRRCETCLAVREIISPTKDRMFLAGHPSQGCFGLQSHYAPCYFFNQASFYPSDFSFKLQGKKAVGNERDGEWWMSIFVTTSCLCQDLGSNAGEGMDVCKCIVPLLHRGTLNNCQAASPLVRLVEGKKRWEAPDHLQSVLPQNQGETEPNRIVASAEGSSITKLATLMGFYDILPLFSVTSELYWELTRLREESSVLSANYYSCSYSSSAGNLKECCSYQAASPLLRLVEGGKSGKPLTAPQCSLSKLERTALKSYCHLYGAQGYS
ncbi:transposable element Tcb2 transposase [Trichonephila clavipes]|nr:transposable element Tcb2 transposase [Trichonephila clavipes]